MNKMNDLIITLVLEYNYSKPGLTLGSVWIYKGDGMPSLEQDAPLGEIPNWVKLVGPIDYEMASSIHANLKSFFEKNGVSVIDKGIAD